MGVSEEHDNDDPRDTIKPYSNVGLFLVYRGDEGDPQIPHGFTQSNSSNNASSAAFPRMVVG